MDPSCSGSGIVNRLDHLLETGEYPDIMLMCDLKARKRIEEEENAGQEERLTKLSNFQLTMIRHAMKCKFRPF